MGITSFTTMVFFSTIDDFVKTFPLNTVKQLQALPYVNVRTEVLLDMTGKSHSWKTHVLKIS